MSQRRLDTFLNLKSDTQQPTPDKDKGERDINVSEAISEGPSSIASASVISQHGPPYIDAAGIKLKKIIFRYQYLVEIYSVSAEKIISDAFSYSENV